MFTFDAVDAGDEPPVDDVPADLREYAGKRRVGNRFDEPAETKYQGEHQ